MADHCSDDESQRSSRHASTTASSLSELQWPQEGGAAAPPKCLPKLLDLSSPEQLLTLSSLTVPPRRTTHFSVYSCDDLRRDSSHVPLSARPEARQQSAAAVLATSTLPPPSWWTCASAFAFPIAFPILLLAGGAVGLFVAGGRPATRWYVPLFAGLSIAAVGALWLVSAWWVQRLLSWWAQGLQVALRATEVEEMEALPAGDRCLDFIVGLINDATPLGQAKVDADPLDFVQKELEGLLHSPRGMVVINTTGVILWVNPSLCQYFGYEPWEILQDNVRVLMPQPYAAQHDSFLRRHLQTGAHTVLGGSREVPVVRRDGTQSIVLLSVDDRIDTRDSDNRLFFGTLDFHHVQEVLPQIQAKLKVCSRIDLSLFQQLDGLKDAMVAINTRGIVLYCNEATTQLFRWERAELAGKNVKVLMAEPFASAHDGFLRRYIEEEERCQRLGRPHVSGIVGSGRDVMARDKSGQRVRVFLMVHRLDLLSGVAADCVFLAKLVHLGASDTSTHGGSSSAFSKGHKGKTVAPSTVAQKLAAENNPRLSPMKVHKCTVVLLRLQLQENDAVLEDPSQLHTCSESLLDLVFHGCANHKGTILHVAGPSIAVLFNSHAVVNTAHRSSAAAFMLQLSSSLTAKGLALVVELQMAAVSAEVCSAKWGAQELVAGNILEVAAALLRVRQEAQVCNPVMDGSLHAELQYSYNCRLVNRIVTNPDEPSDRLVEVFELLSLKETAEDEWMYQLGAEDEKSPWVHWQQAWAHLPAPSTTSSPASLKGRLGPPCSPDNARAALQQHLIRWPQDPTGLALLQLLGDHPLAITAPGRVEYCGSTPFRRQFCPAPPPDAEGLSVPNHSFARSVRQTSDVFLSNISETDASMGEQEAAENAPVHRVSSFGPDAHLRLAKGRLRASCPQCGNFVDNQEGRPLMLKCGHSFCTTCCQALVKGGTIQCPSCDQPTDLHGQGIAALSPNYAFIGLAELSMKGLHRRTTLAVLDEIGATCPICLEGYHAEFVPCMLSCGHSMCRNCCEQYKEACPQCGAKLEEFSVNKPLQKALEALVAWKRQVNGEAAPSPANASQRTTPPHRSPVDSSPQVA